MKNHFFRISALVLVLAQLAACARKVTVDPEIAAMRDAKDWTVRSAPQSPPAARAATTSAP